MYDSCKCLQISPHSVDSYVRMKSVKALFNQLADKLFRGFYYEMLLMHKSQVAH